MRLLCGWFLIVGLLLAPALSVRSQSPTPPVSPAPVPPAWAVSSAPARFVISPDENKPALVSWLDMYLPDPKWVSLPIRVFTDAGVAVSSDILWTSPGGPATLAFDSSSGAKSYKIYVGSDWPAMHLANAKAGVILETRPGDGRIIDKLPDMLQAWNQSSTVNGRAMVNGIFEGGHRFGPQTNTFEHLQGWFELAQPEHLQLSVVSVDSSFVLVDGKEVVEWPGQHDWNYGAQGPPQGGVDLAAGVHQIDYYNAYVASPDGRPPVLCCLAVKDTEFPDWTMLTPDNTFFRPIGHCHIESYELQTSSPGGTAAGGAPHFAIEMAPQGQTLLNWDVPDLGWVAEEFRCYSPPAGTMAWAFDDGTTAQGQAVAPHIFPRPGMRTVKFTSTSGDKPPVTVAQQFDVHINWTDFKSETPMLVEDHEKEMLARDPARFSTPDLSSCFAVFGAFQKDDDMLRFLPAMCDRMKDVAESDLPYITEAALYLCRTDWTRYMQEIQLLQALNARCSQPNPSPLLIKAAGETRLELAELLLETTDQMAPITALVSSIDEHALTREEPRRLRILRADIAFASGDLDGARQQYIALTGDPTGPDARSSIRRTARIGQARAFMDRKDFEAAEDALREVARQAPIEKMSPDWALTRLRLYQEENLPVVAYLWGKRLMSSLTGNARSDLLFRVTDLAFSQNDADMAHKSLAELLKKYPYSEEAAEAKQKWPGNE